MQPERCAECGFESRDWTDRSALRAIRELPDRFEAAVDDLPPGEVSRRPIVDRWSIGEYVDHVREVLFVMRFVTDSAVQNPGVDLGSPPLPEFTSTPKPIDIAVALSGIRREAAGLVNDLEPLTGTQWSATARIDGDTVDLHWVARHAVHDATHHLRDLEALRAALQR